MKKQMITSKLRIGPERPVPCCIAAEKFVIKNLEKLIDENKARRCQNDAVGLDITKRSDWTEMNYFNSDDYEDQICCLMMKYIHIDCFDQILFVRACGDETLASNLKYDTESSIDSIAKDWPDILNERFTLVHDVDVVDIFFNKNTVEPEDEKLESKRSTIGMNFIRKTNGAGKYDKIIFKNCMKYFENEATRNNSSAFAEFLAAHFKHPIQIEPSFIMIQRVEALNTLPFYSSINSGWSATDAKYAFFIQNLQNAGFMINYDIETFRYIIESKQTWYRSVKQKRMYPLNNESQVIEQTLIDKRAELVSGVRELNEGIFKYQPNVGNMEMQDRVLFVTGYKTTEKELKLAQRKLDRTITNRQPVHPLSKFYYLELTPELKANMDN